MRAIIIGGIDMFSVCGAIGRSRWTITEVISLGDRYAEKWAKNCNIRLNRCDNIEEAFKDATGLIAIGKGLDEMINAARANNISVFIHEV